MNFEIFFALIGLPIFILITAVACYIHSGTKEQIISLKNELSEIKKEMNKPVRKSS